MTETIGFVGVGRMGSRMAANLVDSGWEVLAYDVDPERVAAAEADGARGVESLSDLKAADVVMTSLPTSEIVEDVYLDDGLLSVLREGSIAVEMSTISPELMETIADAAADRSVEIVDCPVIGPPPEAADATLTIVVGASEEAFERVEPILARLGNRIDHVGEPGVAKRIKLANNVMTYGNFAVAAEMIGLVSRMGIDPKRFFDITQDGVAGSEITRAKAPKAFREDFEPGFTLDGLHEDLSYALEMKDRHDHPAPVAAAVSELYTLAAATEGGERDYSVLVDVMSEFGETETN